MKRFLLVISVASMFLSEAFASGYVVCFFEATVKQVQAIGVLGDTVSINRISKEDTYRYVATIDISNSSLTRGHGECPIGDQLIELEKEGQVKAGDLIKVESTVVHDRPGHSTTYKLKYDI